MPPSQIPAGAIEYWFGGGWGAGFGGVANSAGCAWGAGRACRDSGASGGGLRGPTGPIMGVLAVANLPTSSGFPPGFPEVDHATMQTKTEVGPEEVRDLEQLRAYVHKTLCDRENILQDQFGLTETVVWRNGEACGLQFCLCGPRSIRLEAIWVADRNLLYCYDARGARFLKVQLRWRVALSAA